MHDGSEKMLITAHNLGFFSLSMKKSGRIQNKYLPAPKITALKFENKKIVGEYKDILF